MARTASQEEIKRVYRRLAKKYHPDMNPGDPEAEERFKLVSAAGEILTDPEKRKIYDEFGEESLRSGFDPHKARAAREGFEPFWGFRTRRSGAWSTGDIFGGVRIEDLFSNEVGSARRGVDLQAELEIGMLEALRGGARDVTLVRHETCSSCRGTGFAGGPCAVCGGRGAQPRTARLRVEIPAGVESGAVITMPGQGEAGRGGGPPGDLLLEVQVQPHPSIERRHNDVIVDLPITVGEALEGAEVRVPTLTSTVSLKIPEGSRSGQMLRLRGRGVRTPAGTGDLYFRLQIQLPRGSTPGVAQAVRTLEGLYDDDVRKDFPLR